MIEANLGGGMTQVDQYFLGYRQAEQQRLQLQAEMLAQEAHDMFERIRVREGMRVVEIGCGPQGTLDILPVRRIRPWLFG
jgi:hypothetical protein